MLLRELFTSLATQIVEGGNLRIGQHDADEIDLKVHNRTYMVGILNKLLNDINQAFNAQYKKPLWSPELLKSQQFLGGSSLSFFNTSGISDEVYQSKKPKVGDIDTQCNKELEPQVHEFLTNLVNKKIGNATFLGFSRGNEQYNGLFQLDEPPVKMQIDFEFGRYDPETNTPDEWFKFSHSSEWEDIEAGIKGVFHKYIYRALASVSKTPVYFAEPKGRGKNRAIVFSDEPINMNKLSFAVASSQGGGVSTKLAPYIDPATGQPMYKDGIPVMHEVPSQEREYIQGLSQQFEIFFGRKPTPEDSKLQKSFVGTLELMNKYLTPETKQVILKSFIKTCFSIGVQMITRDDPKRDAEIKFVAVDRMIDTLKIPEMRQYAIEKAKAYEEDFHEFNAFKAANPDLKQPRAAFNKHKEAQAAAQTQPVAESVVQSKRKGVVHLEKMKDLDFLDLLEQLKDSSKKKFFLNNIKMTVKIDGLGGRFGKDSNGRPFFESSSSGPIQTPGAFSAFAKHKGFTDPIQLARAENYDNLYDQIIEVISIIDKKYGEDFLKNTKVHCEVLYTPMASEENGKLKFVSVAYDKLPAGVSLALVPLFVEESSTGNSHPKNDLIKKKLTQLGKLGSSMFIDNTLIHGGEIDVTGIVAPLNNIDELKGMLLSRKRDLKQEANQAIQPIKDQFAKFVIEHPDIIGKDRLGQDYEGIILYTDKGPVKITSPHFKNIMATKAAAKSQTARPQEGKHCVVTGGSLVGHKGHMMLVNTILNVAESQNRTPFIYVSSAVGPDDPIPVDLKIKTWQKLYPEHAASFQPVAEGGSIMKKIEKELIFANGYKDILLIVGSDRAEGFEKWANQLRKRLANPQYPENQDVVLTVKPRQEFNDSGQGVRFTDLRNILKDPNASEEDQLNVWCQGFDEGKLGRNWIKTLMDISKKNMGIASPINTLENALLEMQEDLNRIKR